MNIADPGFRAYWRESIAKQVEAGDYDGVFLDSASPALLQWEARTPPDRRLLETGVRFNRFPELGDRSWIQAWEEWVSDLDRHLGSRGIPLIPNVGALATSWDNTDYTKTAGVFSEGFLDPGLDMADWRAAAGQTLALARQGKIVILQNNLGAVDDTRKREYLLGNYLLVKGSRTYLTYFANSMLEWYPEWDVDLGAAEAAPATIDDLMWRGVYARRYARGIVLVNPSTRTISVSLDRPMTRMLLEGGGRVGADGVVQGRLSTAPVSRLDMPSKSAAVLQ
jgi:hypothetical protein